MNVKFNFKELAVQVAVCATLLLLTPAIMYLITLDPKDALTIISFIAPVLVPCFILFFLNYYLLLPKLFYNGHKAWFYISNLAMLPLIKYNFFFDFLLSGSSESIPKYAWVGIGTLIFTYILFYIGTICLAWGILNSKRGKILHRQLAEERQRHSEAELVWLKNQLNPHFLFNTLNNISSLAAIDIDRAQDSIAILSDLLRYAIYDSNKPSVPLAKETEFMQNYIELMNLRCSGKTKVETSFDISSPGLPIAPLLLVCFIENAYKHGLSNSHESFIRLSLKESDGNLTFVCDNSNFPKIKDSHSGNGIGLRNMRRRLDLLYQGRYSWEQTLDNDVYHVRITISLCEISAAQ